MRYFCLIFGLGLIGLAKWTLSPPVLSTYIIDAELKYNLVALVFYVARFAVMLVGVIITAVSGARVLVDLTHSRD